LSSLQIRRVENGMKGYWIEGMAKESSRAAIGAAWWRSRPRRRAVDRADMENVKLWKCGNMEMDYWSCRLRAVMTLAESMRRGANFVANDYENENERNAA
jgi:hypothetical protein